MARWPSALLTMGRGVVSEGALATESNPPLGISVFESSTYLIEEAYMFIALNLIALAVGYLVFLEATKQKNSTKTFGRIIGIFIITAALGMTLLTFLQRSSANCLKKSGCPMGMKVCPFKLGR